MKANAGKRWSPARRALVMGGVVAVSLMAWSTSARPDPAKLGDASADRILASVVIPDATRKVGQVRLLSRGDAVVVQTLLSTKLLERVIAEVGKKEGANWPSDDEAVKAYLAALDAARETVEKRDPGPDWKDRRRRLLIEFAADAEDATVFVGTFQYPSEGEDGLPRTREVLTTLSVPRAYVLRNIRLILADSFKLPEAQVDSLGALGPAASATPKQEKPKQERPKQEKPKAEAPNAGAPNTEAPGAAAPKATGH